MNHRSLPSTAPRCRRKVANPKAPDHSSELSAWSSTSPRIGLPWRDAAPVSGAAAPYRAGSSPPQAASTVGSVTPATPSSSPRCDAQARKSRRPTNLDPHPFTATRLRRSIQPLQPIQRQRVRGDCTAATSERRRQRAARRRTGRSRWRGRQPTDAPGTAGAGASLSAHGQSGGAAAPTAVAWGKPAESALALSEAVGTDTDRRGGLAGPGKGPCGAQ